MAADKKLTEIINLQLTPKEALAISCLYTLGSMLINGDISRAMYLTDNYNELFKMYSREEKSDVAVKVSLLGEAIPKELLEELGMNNKVESDSTELVQAKIKRALANKKTNEN